MSLINCKECRKEISNKAEKCPYCGVKLKSKTSIGTWIGTVFILYILYSIGTCSNKIAETKTATTLAPTPATATVETPLAVEEKSPNSWDYYTGVDDIVAKQYKTIGILSNNIVELQFPHQGGTSATVIIRNHPRHGKDIIFKVSTGQLNCQYNNCYINIRFDDGSVIKNYVSEPADHSSDTYFLSNYKKTFNQIKNSKKMYVEVTFYTQGTYTFEFNTENMDSSYLEL